MLSGIKYALDHDMIPVVDMQTRSNIYLRPDEVGKANAWEFYFEQPCGYSLSDIAHAAHVTIWSDYRWCESPCAEKSFLSGADGRLEKWRELARKYVRVKGDVLSRIEARRQELFGESMDGVIGVFVRGTDYVRLRPYRHTVQPDPKVVLADVRKAVREKRFERVFLVTEDRAVYEMFHREFGERLLTVSSEFVDYNGGYIGDCRKPESHEGDYRRRGEEYLTAILLLAQCSHSIESRAGGSEMAAIFATGERHPSYYYLCLYGRFGVISE